jgi:hypothetical protein
MSKPVKALRKEVAAILDNSHCFPRFSETLRLLDSLIDGVTKQIIHLT